MRSCDPLATHLVPSAVVGLLCLAVSPPIDDPLYVPAKSKIRSLYPVFISLLIICTVALKTPCMEFTLLTSVDNSDPKIEYIKRELK